MIHIIYLILIVLAYNFGWTAAHRMVARESELLGKFFVGSKVFKSELIEDRSPAVKADLQPIPQDSISTNTVKTSESAVDLTHFIVGSKVFLKSGGALMEVIGILDNTDVVCWYRKDSAITFGTFPQAVLRGLSKQTK